MADLYEQIKEAAEELLTKAKDLVSSDIPIIQRWGILYDMVTDVVLVVQQVAAPGDEKRKLAQQLIEQLYDVLAAYDIPYVPEFIERPAEKSIKPVVVDAIMDFVDRTVARFNRADAWATLSVTAAA